MILLHLLLIFIASANDINNICITDKDSDCPKDVTGLAIVKNSDFKASDVYFSGTVNLYVYSDASSVVIEAKEIKGDLNVFGSSISGSIKFKFNFFLMPKYSISLHQISVKIVDDAIYATNFFLDNVKLTCEKAENKLKIFVTDLKSDAKSLVEAIKVEVNKFKLTEVQKDLDIDINVEIAGSFITNTVVDIYADVSAGIKAVLKRREVDITCVDGKHSVKITSDVALPQINFQNIKKNVEVVRDGFLNMLEMFTFTFDLEGGKLMFPEDKWPLSFSLKNFVHGLCITYFQIVQNISSVIEIGAQYLPASIENQGSEPLDIKAIALKCGITGSLFINNTLDRIHTELNGVLEFSVYTIQKISDTAKLISDKDMQILSKIEPAMDVLSDKIRNIVEKISVKYEDIKKEIFNLADNGHLAIDFKFYRDGFLSLGSIEFSAAVKRNSEGKFTLDLKGNAYGHWSDYSFEKIKSYINKPQNLICSKVEINAGDWILNAFGDAFFDLIKLQYGESNGLHCLQFVLTRLPDALSEKYCVGNDCPNGYTAINKDTLKNLKDKIDSGTRKVALSIKDAIDKTNSLDFSAFGGNLSFSIEGNKKDLYIDLDLKIKDHIYSLDISKTNLNFNIQNEETNNYFEVNIPYLSLNDLTVDGQLKDKKISFTGEEVKTDLKTFKQLVESKFNNLVLDLDNTGILESVNNVLVGADKIEFKAIGTVVGSLNRSNIAGDLSIKFITSTLFDLKLNLDSNVKSTKGFKFVVKKGASIGAQVINFADEWAKLEDVGSGITISHDSSLKLKNVPGNIDLSLEGRGNVEIELKSGTKSLEFKKSIEFTGNVKFTINGNTVFTDLHFSGRSYLEISSSSSSLNLLADNQKVVVSTATCNEGSYAHVGNIVVNNKLVMEPGSLLRAKSIQVTDKPIHIQYYFSNSQIQTIILFTTSTSSVGLTKPSEITLEYMVKISDNKEINYEYFVGSSLLIYSASDESFTNAKCEEYAKLVKFSSDYVGLNGDSSALKVACISVSDSEGIYTCLAAELTEVPSLKSVEGKKKKNLALIIGVTVAAVVVVIIVVIVVVVCFKKNKSNKDDESTTIPKNLEA